MDFLIVFVLIPASVISLLWWQTGRDKFKKNDIIVHKCSEPWEKSQKLIVLEVGIEKYLLMEDNTQLSSNLGFGNNTPFSMFKSLVDDTHRKLR